jgi:hypothetical protein
MSARWNRERSAHVRAADREPSVGGRCSAIALLAAIACVGATAAPVRAEGGSVFVTCDFMEISATKGKAPAMDPRLAAVERRLRKPPFSQWTEFKQLSQTSRRLEKGKAESVPLARGGATATLIEVVDKSKARLTVTISNARGKPAVQQTSLLDAGDYVIHTVVLPPNDDGHLVAVTCK